MTNEEAIKIITGIMNNYHTDTVMNRRIDEALSAAMQALTAEPVKYGSWIFGETKGHSWMKCSECCVSQSGQTATFTYCPNCGADMQKGESEKK